MTRSHLGPILHSGLFVSPQKSFQLPLYAESAAEAFANSTTPTYESRGFSGNPRVLDYLDISADECDDDLDDQYLHYGDDASSSMSLSGSASSCSSSPSSTSHSSSCF